MTASSTPTSARGPRWGVQASLTQPRQPAFWLFVVALAIGGYFFLDEQVAMSALAQAFAVSWLLVLAYALPVAVAVYRLDLFEREPKLMLAGALLWGGVIATSFAGFANEAWLSVLGKIEPDLAAPWGSAIVGPGVEETLKLMGVVTLYLIASSEFDGVMDGFVYGALVGLGFTVVEDVSYFIHAAALAPGGVSQSGPVWDTFLIRVVGGGLYGHVLFTGLTGIGFAYLVTRRRSALPGRLLGGGLCIAAGFAAHAVWNSPWMQTILATDSGEPSVTQWIAYGAVKGLPFLLLLGLLVAFATRSEEANFRAIVAGEPDPAVITESEIVSLRSLLARRSARLAAGRVGGPAASRLVGRLQAAQVEYALIRSRVDSLDDPALEVERQKIRSIRAELARLPGAAAPTQGAGAPVPGAVAQGDWAPTHLAPSGGIVAWASPVPSQPPVAVLPAWLELTLESRAGDWAQVRAANGWRAWVDGRLLVPRG
jgi:RsiW-degrading membrane proteinase PrsW (M82 family)